MDISEGNRVQTMPLAVASTVLAVGFCWRVWNATGDFDHLLRTTLPDDAFYYFGIARHLALGDPPSIDGIHPTNGYHPLWMLLLVPLYALMPSGSLVAPVRVAMVLGALFDTISGALLWRICRRVGLGVGASAVALATFSVNPHQVINATCGLETSLALCLALLVVTIHLEFRTSSRPLRFGVASGLAILARTDLIVLVACLCTQRAVALWQDSGARAMLRWTTPVLVSVACLLAPWAAYSFSTTGAFVQSSGIALAFVHHSMPALWGVEQPGTHLMLARVLGSMTEGANMLLRWHGVSATVATGAGLAGLASVIACKAEHRRKLFRRIRPLLPLFAALTLLFLIHTAVRQVFREWYTAPFIAVTAIVVGLFTQHNADWSRRPRAIMFGAAGALGVWLGYGASAWGTPLYSQVRAGHPSSTIHEGHSDCGIVSYFTGRGITNLDGIVNQSALDALIRGKLLEYVRHEHFQRIYVTDYYHSSVFFGPRYREALVSVDRDPHAVRVPNSRVEKNVRIGPTSAEAPLGGFAGREYLSDGWLWNDDPRPVASSLGSKSELLVYLPRRWDDVRLHLRLSASVVDDRGVQPVSMFVNDHPAGRIDVVPVPEVYEVPMDHAVRGRNRIRLEFAAPRAHRSPKVDWWRTIEGNPVLAIDAHGLWLHGGPRRSYHFPVVGPKSVPCAGCYAPEADGTRRWRWTSGHAKLDLPLSPPEASGECWLKISGRAPHAYRVRWDGILLDGANGAYVLPGSAEPLGRGHQLDIDSDVFVPASAGDSADTRALGVALESVSAVCW